MLQNVDHHSSREEMETSPNFETESSMNGTNNTIEKLTGRMDNLTVKKNKESVDVIEKVTEWLRKSVKANSKKSALKDEKRIVKKRIVGKMKRKARRTD